MPEYPSPVPGHVLVGVLPGADFNSTGDQPILLNRRGFTKIRFGFILASNPSVSMTAAQGGIYSGSGKTGVAIVAAAHAYTGLVDVTSALALTIATGSNIKVWAQNTFYFSLTTAQGAPATADIHLFAYTLP